MSIFKKIGKGIKNATKAVGKGVANAAKFTVKNPLKVIAPIAAVGGLLMTGGAIAPALAGKLAATKVGGTLFGKMVTKTMSTGTVVKSKIANTLQKVTGKKASNKDIDIVEQGLQAEIKKRKGYKLPVDKTSKSGTEARAKLKAISNELTDNQLSFEQQQIRDTLNAERQVLIDNPETNGILSKSDLSDDVLNSMKNAGSLKENLLGKGLSIAQSLGLSSAATEKAKDVLDILQGRNSDPYLTEDMEVGTNLIEAKLNKSSILPESISNLFKMPVVWIIAVIGVIYFIVKKSSKSSQKRR